MGIKEFIEKFKADIEFAAKFNGITDFESLLKEVNNAGYSITKEDILDFVNKEHGGNISVVDLEKVAGADIGKYNYSTACSDTCTGSRCSSKC